MLTVNFLYADLVEFLRVIWDEFQNSLAFIKATHIGLVNVEQGFTFFGFAPYYIRKERWKLTVTRYGRYREDSNVCCCLLMIGKLCMYTVSLSVI